MNSSGLSRRAVVVDPVAAGGELVEAQHVHHADGRQAGAEQVGPLRHARADEQAAVAAALDGQLVGLRVLVGDQPLGRGDEVVEDVLLLQLACRPCASPRRTRRRRAGSAWAYTPPISIHASRAIEKPGVSEMLKPP